MAMAKSKTIYDVHPGVAMMVKWVAELKGKTGWSVEECVALVKKEGPEDEKVAARMAEDQAQIGNE